MLSHDPHRHDPNQHDASRQPKIDVVVRPEPLRINQRQSSWHHLKPATSVVTFVVGVIVAATFINAFIFQSYYVEGTSMTPTLHDDDRLIVDKVGHSIASFRGQPYVPNRGDIVVLNSELPDPSEPGSYEQLIKRVVALPGERVLVANGTVTVFNQQEPNGFNVDAELDLHLEPTFSTQRIDARMGPDEVFVTGDNRGPGGSLDSRTFGPVEVRNIEGRLWARVFPLSDAKIF